MPALNRFAVHKFIPFGTIAGRAQIGVNIAGGFGVLIGDVTVTGSLTSLPMHVCA
jgi:hypothetical protein